MLQTCRFLWFVLIFSFISGACTQRANAVGNFTGTPSALTRPQPTSTHTQSPTGTHAATATPSPTVTWTPLPTLTPASTASPTPLACWKQGGRIVTGKLPTDLLPLPIDYRIYLPPCYDQQPQRHYPTLYLFHGQGYTDDQWDRLGADETANTLIGAGEIPPLIIIMPHDRYGGEPDESKYADVILKDLIPYVEKTYRTIPDRTHRAVGGLSRGAGWAVHLAIADWEHFSALGAHSPAIFYYDAERMRVMLDAIPADSYPRIYIDIGNRDRPEIMRVTLWFENLLNERSIPHEWRLFTGYHAEEYWSAHMEQYLRWYTRDW